MKIVSWNPFKDIMMVDELYDKFAHGKRDNRCTWSPSVDVYETDKDFVLTAELPGVHQEDISLSLDETTLTLKGDRRFERDVKQENFFRVERNYGYFNRRFILPCEVEGDSISASFQDGVLKVTIPKAQSRMVQVTVK